MFACAKRKTNRMTPFGGLLCVLSGDFLQLPPVRRKTLAAKMDDAGFVKKTEHNQSAGSGSDDQTELARPEERQGLQLWRSRTNVISLQTNIRSPGILSRLLSEMRQGSISDEMWTQYESRILTKNDGRLTEHPFNTADIRYLVHRHSIRSKQSYEHSE